MKRMFFADDSLETSQYKQMGASFAMCTDVFLANDDNDASKPRNAPLFFEISSTYEC